MRRNLVAAVSVCVLLFVNACGYAQGPGPERPQPPRPPAGGMRPGGMTGPPPMAGGEPGMMGMGMPGMMMGPGMAPDAPFGGEESRRRERLVLEVLKELNPHELEELERLRLVDRRAYTERIEGRWPEAQELDELRRHDPDRFRTMIKLHRMESETHALAQKTRNLEGESRARAMEQLRRALEIFDFKQEQREREVERISKELERLKEGLGRRSERREEIIDRRQGELLGELEPLEW